MRHSCVVVLIGVVDLLIVKFGRVHANDGDGTAGILALKGSQFRQNMHAVNAAVRPEVQHHHLALQLPAAVAIPGKQKA